MIHPTHYDLHALVTVVISLSDYGQDYTGGIYVTTGFNTGRGRVIALRKGDAVAHQSDLLHGVKVEGGKRWSWITWFSDTENCDTSTQADWFRDCAHAGNAVCQYLYATKLDRDESIAWTMRAASQGFGPALVKLATGHRMVTRLNVQENIRKWNAEATEQGFGFALIDGDVAKAAALYRNATEASGEPDGHYAFARMILDGDVPGALSDVVHHLEWAAKGGHSFAMFNLGMAHLYEYAVEFDPDVAAEWFLACGLPEGLAAAARHFNAIGQSQKAEGFQKRAERMGYGSHWRRQARENAGSGGTGNVDINLPWPPLPNGLRPDIY